MKQAATSAGHVKTSAPPTAAGPRAFRALLALRVAALWVLGVSLIKLFQGSPSDLPKVVQDFAGDMDLGLKFQLVCAIELSVVLLAFLRPRWAWPLLVGMFAVFLAILGVLVAQGAKSCGCFGGAITLPPVAMLAIDAACLAAVLATRPWSSLPAGKAPLLAVLGGLAVAWAAPFVVFDNEQLPEQPPIAAVPAPGPADPAAKSPAPPPAPPPATNGGGTAPVGATPPAPAGETPPVAGASKPWSLPAKMPTFQVLSPLKQGWVGKHLKETPLGALIDVELYPLDATWILYRTTCDHCAAEFIEIANDPVRSQKFYVLVQIPESGTPLVTQYPPLYQEAVLPPLARGYVGETPWTLEVEAGVVRSAVFRDEH